MAHDAPYVDVCFDGYVAPSIMQVAGAKDVAIEFNSLSKSYNMGGWRLGMAVGNPQVLSYLHTYKSQMDSSHFAPVLEAGIAALDRRSDLAGRTQRHLPVPAGYRFERLAGAGFTVQTPPATIYLWAHLPPGFTDSTQFCEPAFGRNGRQHHAGRRLRRLW